MVVEPLRVLIANDTYAPQLNGAAVATQRLAQGMALCGHKVAVVAPNMAFRDREEVEPTGAAGRDITVYRIKSIPTRPLHPQFRITSWARINTKLDRIFNEFRPDIVHVQNHFVLGQGCLKQGRKRGIPVVGTNHFMPENLHEYIPKPLRPTISTVMWAHWLRTYNRLDCVVSPSYACQELLRSVGLTAPSRVISNGINLSTYGPAPPDPSIYDRYGIRRGVPTFLCVGRLEKDKKVDLVIRAAALAGETQDFQTIFVGKGRDEVEFQALTRSLGLADSVIFTGFVPDADIPSLYNAADVYIGAGAAELQGIAVMEAMAAGLPILAANSVALPELVEEGVNGLLFEHTPEDLARQMVRILANRQDWEQMGQRSLERIQVHDMPQVLAQLEDLYQQQISAKTGNLVVST